MLFIYLFILFLHEFFDQSIVCQMRKFTGVLGIIIFKSKSNVAFVINPNGKRIPVFNKSPLPYIELFGLDYQGILYVLLYYPMPSFCMFYIIQYFIIVFHYLNSFPLIQISWFYDPKVIFTADIILRIIFFQFRKYILNVRY